MFLGFGLGRTGETNIRGLRDVVEYGTHWSRDTPAPGV